MATFNGAKYLSEQIDSILSQTITDFELVVSDDCSTDNTVEILERYAALDSRIKIIRNERNLGFKLNFENVLRHTIGDFVAPCDQDDIWADNHLEVLLNGIGGKSIACGDSLLVDSNNHSLGMTLSYQEALDYVPEDDLKKAYSVFYFRSPYQGSAMLIRRSFLNVALPIPDDVSYHDVWFSLLGCFQGGIHYVKVPISRYRQHGANVSGSRFERLSKLKSLLRHILREYLRNRMLAATHIINRVEGLTMEQQVFLNNVILHGRRKENILGRIGNFFFELSHYKLIYSCSGKFWL